VFSLVQDTIVAVSVVLSVEVGGIPPLFTIVQRLKRLIGISLTVSGPPIYISHKGGKVVVKVCVKRQASLLNHLYKKKKKKKKLETQWIYLSSKHSLLLSPKKSASEVQLGGYLALSNNSFCNHLIEVMLKIQL
jgi:hypothetical protein